MLNAYPGSLGDSFCANTTVCTDAETAVQQMDNVYQGAPDNVKAQFQSSHDSIMNAYSIAYGYGIQSSLPIVNNCCSLQTIGQEAWDLMQQIQVAMGQTPAPGLSSGMSLTAMLVLAGVGYLAFVYLVSRPR